jgi:hypothetical protein
VANVIEAAERRGVLAGVALARDYPELPDVLLISVTEMNARADFDLLRAALGGGR